MRVGLVLGGGGVFGMAYHAGALAALAHDLGWDPRTSEVIVGTSAGSIVGAMLRLGIPAHDLAATMVGAALVETPPGRAPEMASLPQLPPLTVRHFVHRPRLPNLSLLTSWFLHPGRLGPLGVLTSTVRDGELDVFEYTGLLRDGLGDSWPDKELWLTAVRRRDLRPTVFGRDLRPGLGAAVAASCAVPGYFTPIVIDGEQYVDGGVRSPTNADLLVGRRDLDLAIVVSAMSARDRLRVGLGSAVRSVVGRRLRREVQRLRSAQIPTVVIEPGADVVGIAGLDVMNAGHAADIVRESFLDTGELLRAPVTRTLLAGLSRDRENRSHATSSRRTN